MKIGFVLDDTLDSTDGVQQYVLLLGGWLRKNGHEVHYLVSKSLRTDIKNIHSLAKNIEVNFNKNRLRIPLPASNTEIKNILFKEKFNVLHIQMPYSPLLAGKIIKLAPESTKIVGTFHIAPYSKLVTYSTKFLAQLQRKDLLKISSIISVSEVAWEFAHKTIKAKSVIIPNAVDMAKYLPKENVEKEYDIIFVGRFVARKGCIYLLKALRQLKENYPNLSLRVAIVGKGPKCQQLKKYVKDNGLSKWCVFFGYVNEDKKVSLLQSSKLAIFPSTGGESFGIVLIEAMASKTLVLAGNNHGYHTVMTKKSKTLFDPKNYKELAEIINKYLNQNDEYKAELNFQQNLIKKFDIEKVGSAIMQVYLNNDKGLN